MDNLLLRGGQAIGLLGVLMMAIAVIARLAGRFGIGPISTGSLLIASIGAVSVACFLLLWLLVLRLPRR